MSDKPKGGRPSKNSGDLPAYSQKAADDLGVDVTTIRRDLRRGRDITPDVLAEVAGTDLDKGVVLDELARTAPDDQPMVLVMIRRTASGLVGLSSWASRHASSLPS